MRLSFYHLLKTKASLVLKRSLYGTIALIGLAAASATPGQAALVSWSLFSMSPFQSWDSKDGAQKPLPPVTPDVTSSSMSAASSFQALDSKDEVQKIIQFLTADISDGGITYMGTAINLKKKLPLSYYCTPKFWVNYVLPIWGSNTTIDLYIPGETSLTPAPTYATPAQEGASVTPDSPGTPDQLERIAVQSGCNIYDAATWQIALALAGHDGIKGASGEDLFTLVDNQTSLLNLGYDGNTPDVPIQGSNRRLSEDEGIPKFAYNGHFINNTTQAYFYRMVSRTPGVADPLGIQNFMKVQNTLNGNIDDLSNATDRPANDPYPRICISWQDWMPITGENVWAFLIGPLQAELIRYQAQPCVPFNNNLAVQNALAILETFQKMQCELGALYRCPVEALQNNDADAFNVSVENNMSVLGGLLVFRKVLRQEQAHSLSLSLSDQQKINNALATIQTMIYGGSYSFTDESGIETYSTKGLLSFFKEKAWDKTNKQFFMGGIADQPNNPNGDWDPTKINAVDVNTWGLAVLGQPIIDNLSPNDFGRSYELWQNVKRWAGYCGPDKELWGVGYTDSDKNGIMDSEGKGISIVHKNDDNTGIMSGEWTAGAINMLRCLITQYTAIANSTTDPNHDKARDYVTKLQQDHDSMVKHLTSLRTDKYPTEPAFNGTRPPAAPEDAPPGNSIAASITNCYTTLINIPAANRLGYLYASRRYFIPFGWYANPIPSMASTAWAVMVDYNFNPFSENGDYSANSL